MIKRNGLNIFENNFYTQRMQMIMQTSMQTTFFLKDEKSITELMKTFDISLTFSGLKLIKSKCEIAGF